MVVGTQDLRPRRRCRRRFNLICSRLSSSGVRPPPFFGILRKCRVRGFSIHTANNPPIEEIRTKIKLDHLIVIPINLLFFHLISGESLISDPVSSCKNNTKRRSRKPAKWQLLDSK